VDAIEKAKELHPDLIILDLAMPRMNGAAAASVLKRRMPKTPIVLFTIYDGVMGKALASAVNVDLVLAKPNGLNEMVTHVQDLLNNPLTSSPAQFTAAQEKHQSGSAP
jgi:CheY-like chemotaxis protein